MPSRSLSPEELARLLKDIEEIDDFEKQLEALETLYSKDTKQGERIIDTINEQHYAVQPSFDETAFIELVVKLRSIYAVSDEDHRARFTEWETKIKAHLADHKSSVGLLEHARELAKKTLSLPPSIDITFQVEKGEAKLPIEGSIEFKSTSLTFNGEKAVITRTEAPERHTPIFIKLKNHVVKSYVVPLDTKSHPYDEKEGIFFDYTDYEKTATEQHWRLTITLAEKAATPGTPGEVPPVVKKAEKAESEIVKGATERGKQGSAAWELTPKMKEGITKLLAATEHRKMKDEAALQRLVGPEHHQRYVSAKAFLQEIAQTFDGKPTKALEDIFEKNYTNEDITNACSRVMLVLEKVFPPR